MEERDTVQLNFYDDDRAPGSMKVRFPGACSHAAMLGWLQAVIINMPGISDAGLHEIIITRTYIDPSKGKGTSSSTNALSLVLIFELEGGGYAIQTIPSPVSLAGDREGTQWWEVDATNHLVVAGAAAFLDPRVRPAGLQSGRYLALYKAYVGRVERRQW